MKAIKQIKQIINAMTVSSSTPKISSTILLRKIKSIERQLEEDYKLENAEQQFLGFSKGKYFGNIIELVSSMDLKKWEWHYLKTNEFVNCLESGEIEEIDNYLKKQTGDEEGKYKTYTDPRIENGKELCE